MGCFFVKKKDGNIRMVIDCRRTNRCHLPPPKTSLGGPLGLRELDLSGLDELCEGLGFDALSPEGPGAGEADVRDAFYQFAVPELGSWFCIDERFRAGELGITRAWCDAACGYVPVTESTHIYLAFDAMCMGWSWALHFCQSAVTSAAAECGGEKQILVDKRLAPELLPGQPVQSVYVDNFTTVGVLAKDVIKSGQTFDSTCQRLGFTTHAEIALAKVLDTVGVRLDVGGKMLLHKPRRVWRFYLATLHLLRLRCVQYDWLAIWLGHGCCISGLAPGLLSICQEIYPFVAQRRGQRGPIPRRIATEMRDMANLSFLSGVDLGARYGPEIYCGDSSGFAWGLITSEATDSEQRCMGKYRERWRFKHCEEPPATQQSPDAFCGQDGEPSPLGGWEGALWRNEDQFLSRAHTGVEARVRRSAGFGKRPKRTAVCSVPVDARMRDRRVVYRPEGIPPLPSSVVVEDRWKLAIRQRWAFPEHINVLELRVAVSAVQRAARDSRFLGKRLLLLSDNMVAVCLLEKGRSRIRSLNRFCRKAAGYVLATGIDIRIRYLETDRNPADGPSRMQKIGWHPPLVSSGDEGCLPTPCVQPAHAKCHASVTTAQLVAPVQVVSLFDAIFPKVVLLLADHLPVDSSISGTAHVLVCERAPPGLVATRGTYQPWVCRPASICRPCPAVTLRASHLFHSSLRARQQAIALPLRASPAARVKFPQLRPRPTLCALWPGSLWMTRSPLSRTSLLTIMQWARAVSLGQQKCVKPRLVALFVHRHLGGNRFAIPWNGVMLAFDLSLAPLQGSGTYITRQLQTVHRQMISVGHPQVVSQQQERVEHRLALPSDFPSDLAVLLRSEPESLVTSRISTASTTLCGSLTGHALEARRVFLSSLVDVRVCLRMSVVVKYTQQHQSIYGMVIVWISRVEAHNLNICGTSGKEDIFTSTWVAHAVPGALLGGGSPMRKGQGKLTSYVCSLRCFLLRSFGCVMGPGCFGVWKIQLVLSFGTLGRSGICLRCVVPLRCALMHVILMECRVSRRCCSQIAVAFLCSNRSVQGSVAVTPTNPLQGAKRVLCADGAYRWLGKTKLAGAYTHSLCRAWSLAISRAAPPTARKKARPKSDPQLVSELHAAMPRASRQAAEEVRATVERSLDSLVLRNFDDEIAEADLYELADASASGTQGPDLTGARKYIASHRVVFGGGRIRGKDRPAASRT